MTKGLVAITVLVLTAIGLAINVGCQTGWALAVCLDEGASIYPAFGGGELLVTEVISLAVCLIGIGVSLASYANGAPQAKRVSGLFLMFFIILMVGENNLMRDDIRPQFLMVLLIWLSVELMIRRWFLPIPILMAGCAIPFLGQLGDHTTQIAFENLFDHPITESALAPAARLFGWLEEPLELVGATMFVLAALTVLTVRPPPRRAGLSIALCVAAIVAITLGNTYLHITDTNVHESLRKVGFFTSILGVACASACAFAGYFRAGQIDRAHGAMLTVVMYWIAVYAPTAAFQQHSKTISSWLWIVPVLVGYYYLMKAKSPASREEDAAPERERNLTGGLQPDQLGADSRT